MYTADMDAQLLELYVQPINSEDDEGPIRFKGILEIIKELGLKKSQFYALLASEPTFADAYERAKKARIDVVIDQIIKIADDTATADDNTKIASARLRIDARKWLAEKLDERYSAKYAVSTSNNLTNLNEEEIRARLESLRKKAGYLTTLNPLN